MADAGACEYESAAGPDAVSNEILVVEDNAETSRLIEFILRHAGYQVRVAKGYTEAVAAIEGTTFLLYLLDQNLNGTGTGIDLCLRIKAGDRTLPVVFCSALDDHATRAAAVAAGCDFYMVKPSDTLNLIPVVRTMLAQRTLACAGSPAGK